MTLITCATRPIMDTQRISSSSVLRVPKTSRRRRNISGRGDHKKHRDAVGQWMVNLFSGSTAPAISELERVGMAHVKINLPTPLRERRHALREEHSGHRKARDKNSREQAYSCGSVEKILDINRRFHGSYMEEEKGRVSYRVSLTSYISRGGFSA